MTPNSMRIDKDQLIGDLPAIEVRRFMQRRRDWVFARESLKDFFPHISDDKLPRALARKVRGCSS
jgi:hypothetical protein